MTADYEIQISGVLHKRWSRWFNDAGIMILHQEDRPSFTTFHCPVLDQARLRGVLNTIWDLNLELISVQRLPPTRRDEKLISEHWSLVTDMEDSDV